MSRLWCALIIMNMVLLQGYLFPGLCASEEKSFYHDSRRGFYWGEDVPEKEKDKPMQDTKKESKKSPSLKDYTEEQLWRMDPDTFNELREAITKRAVGDTSNEEYIGEYAKVIELSAQRARAFANAHHAYLSKHPEHNIAASLPLAAPGRIAVTKEQRREVSRRLKNAQDDFALIYFYAPGCEACNEQGKILQYFTGRYNWNIKSVDVTSSPPGARAFGVQMTPTLLVVSKRSGEYLTVSVGVAAVTEIEDTLYRNVRLLNGEITPEEYTNYEFWKGGPLEVVPPGRR